MSSKGASRSFSLSQWLILLILSALCVALLFAPITTLLIHKPFDYNEGWNAYNIRAVQKIRSLYHLDSEYVFNNYPPFAFVPSFIVSKIVGDTIVAARLVALVGLLFTALNIGLMVKRILNDQFFSVLASLIFLLSAGVWVNNFTAMADPQWLGHAIQSFGLYVVLSIALDARKEPSSGSIAFAAFLMVMGGLVKANLIVVPFALSLWLAVYNRRCFVVFVCAGCIWLLASLALCWLIFGPSVFHSVFGHHRIISLQHAMLHITTVTMMLGPWCIFAVLLILVCRTPSAVLFFIYFSAAVGIGFVARAGEGVDLNAFFDAIIGAAVIVTLAISWVESIVVPREKSRALVFGTTLFLVPLMGGLPLVTLFQRTAISRIKESGMAEEIIARLRAAPGPVMCETLAYCFWAGKPRAIDFFNYGQQIKTGHASAAHLIEEIRQKKYAMIQFELRDLSYYFGTADIQDAMHKNYEVSFEAAGSRLLVPRQ